MGKGQRLEAITAEMRVTSFWLQVQVGLPDECWLWTGYVEKGYGRFFTGRRMSGAHEMALTYATGEQRVSGYDTCHSCHTPLCCNPAHLRFAPRQANVDDMTSAGRQARGETNGHSKLTEDDVVAIRHRHAAGAACRKLATDFGVSPAAVTLIVTGQRWPHAGGPIRSTHGNIKHGRNKKDA